MNKTGCRTLVVTIVLLVGCTTCLADPTYSFSILPTSGAIQGPPGSKIGWGYSITNQDSADWLVTSNIASDPIMSATPDSSPFDLPIIAPLTTVTLPFDSVNNTGLFALTWDASAPTGFINSGLFTLSAEWWSGDPFAGGSFLQNALDETAAFTATVSQPTGPSVPEPRTIPVLIAVALLFLKFVRGRSPGPCRLPVTLP